MHPVYMTVIRKVDQVNPDPSVIAEAAAIIVHGGTVVFPTETVYGLGADATNNSAVLGIYRAKGRPPDNPLIVHFSSIEMMHKHVHVTRDVQAVQGKIWPGPLTIIMKSRESISKSARASLPTVGARIPANPLALALIAKSRVPIAAPSANMSTKPSIVSSSEAIHELDGKVDLILDAGETFFGIESTVIRKIEGGYEILRPGAIGVEELEPLIGKIVVSDAARGWKDVDTPITPGMKYRHYSPVKQMYRIEDTGKFIRHVKEADRKRVGVICSAEVSEAVQGDCINLGSTTNLYEIARNLYPSFRKLDAGNYEEGIIHGFPETGIGLAIMNRIRKASILIG